MILAGFFTRENTSCTLRFASYPTFFNVRRYTLSTVTGPEHQRNFEKPLQCKNATKSHSCSLSDKFGYKDKEMPKIEGSSKRAEKRG